jgi:hypothetical protein
MILNFDSRSFLNKKIKPLKVGVFGSRTLNDERIRMILLEKFKELQATLIVTCQEPQGVSKVAQRICKDLGFPLQLHFRNMQYKMGAFEQRSREVIAEADYFLILHDGKSKGTLNEKKMVEESGKPFFYAIVEPVEYDFSVYSNSLEDLDFKGDYVTDLF